MKVEILYHPGDGNYTWELYTGPDGINEYNGLASSLGECFEEIISRLRPGIVHYHSLKIRANAL